MGLEKNVVSSKEFENRKRFSKQIEKLDEVNKKIADGYLSDIREYKNYCEKTEQEENERSFLDFLYITITKRKNKKDTWEKRVVALRSYFYVEYDIEFGSETQEHISSMRKLFQEDEYRDLKKRGGKEAVDPEKLLEKINELDTRERAICLVNLVTANRPNEMVNLKVEYFNLESNYVSVYMQKQVDWHNKRLTDEVVEAVKDYVEEYKLQPDDYFVGAVTKGGEFQSRKVSENGYRKMLDRWTGLSPYNFRKTQVAKMHLAGADLSTIAKQTGHRSTRTLDKHYLDVFDPTVDKYL